MNYYKLHLLCLIILFSISDITSIHAQTLRVASYNLRYDNPKDSLDNWKYRKSDLFKLIKFHDFEIFGTQEGLKHQLDELSEEFPDYNYIGVGRKDGKEAGEHAAIFYNTNKFSLLENGDFWLSQITTKPNKGWDAALPRICTWGKFKEKESGFEFYFFNTHFDHKGKVARIKSAELILKQIKKKVGDTAIILTGDFNVDQNSKNYKILNSSPILNDAYLLSKLTYGASGTINGFNVNNTTKSRIDNIFVSDEFNVLKYGILTDTYRIDEKELKKVAGSKNFPKEISFYHSQPRYPSDHFPVLTVLKVEK